MQFPVPSVSREEKALFVVALVLDTVLIPSIAAWLVLLSVPGAHHAFPMPWNAWWGILTDPAIRSLYLVLTAALFFGAGWLVVKNRDGGGLASQAGGHNAAYGSARWRSKSELGRGLSRWQAGADKHPAGLVVGADPGGKYVSRAWVVAQDGHNLIIGAPGARKTTNIVEPTLNVLAQSGQSAIVTDPKGELYEQTAALFGGRGYDVLRLDLRDPSLSVRWNPLSPISEAMGRGDTAQATRLSRELAQILTAQAAPNGDPFWQQSAASLITALTLAVADKADPDKRHLASVYQTLIDTGEHLDEFFASLPAGHPASQAYGVVRLSPAETRRSQYTVTAAPLSLFGDPSIGWLTSESEFKPRLLATKPQVVYIVVPDDSTAYYPLATLFVSQILQALAAEASRRPGGKLANPVHFILDEFGNFPKVPDFEKALAVARGRGIRITLVLQAFSQLDAQYGPEVANVMRNVCNTWVYLSSNDVDTGRLVSEKTGQTTVQTTSRGMNWQGQAWQGNRNETTAYTSRSLLTLDEVLRWPLGQALVLQAGQLPAKLPLRPFSEWPRLHGPWSTAIRRRNVAAASVWVPHTDSIDEGFMNIDLDLPDSEGVELDGF